MTSNIRSYIKSGVTDGTCVVHESFTNITPLRTAKYPTTLIGLEEIFCIFFDTYFVVLSVDQYAHFEKLISFSPRPVSLSPLPRRPLDDYNEVDSIHKTVFTVFGLCTFVLCLERTLWFTSVPQVCKSYSFEDSCGGLLEIYLDFRQRSSTRWTPTGGLRDPPESIPLFH